MPTSKTDQRAADPDRPIDSKVPSTKKRLTVLITVYALLFLLSLLGTNNLYQLMSLFGIWLTWPFLFMESGVAALFPVVLGFVVFLPAVFTRKSADGDIAMVILSLVIWTLLSMFFGVAALWVH